MAIRETIPLAEAAGQVPTTLMRLLEGIFGRPDPPPPPPPTNDEIRMAEKEVRIDRALRESAEVSRKLADLSDHLRMLVYEYRRVRR